MITYSNWRYRCNGFVWLWPEAYLEVDGAGVVVEWNPRAEEVFGWRRAEVVGRLADATLLPGALGEPMALVAGAVVGERQDPPRTGTDGSDHVRFELRHRAGQLVAVEGRLFVTGQNGDRSIGGFITPCGSDRLIRGAMTSCSGSWACCRIPPSLPTRSCCTIRSPAFPTGPISNACWQMR